MNLLLLVALAVAFIFSGIEAGVLALNRMRLRRRALEGRAAAMALERLLEHPARLTVTLALVTQTARLLALWLILERLQGWWGMERALWCMVLVLPFLALFLEFLPKLIFRRFPYRILVWLARLLQWTDQLLSPVLVVGRWCGVEKLWRDRRHLPGSQSNVDLTELRQAFNASTGAGVITPLQKHLLHSVLNGREVKVGDMAVAVDVHGAVPGHLEVREVLKRAAGQSVDSLLITGEDGMPMGYLRTIDLLLDGITSGRAQSYARQLISIGAEVSLLEAIIKMRAARAPLALCRVGEGKVGVLAAESLVRRLLHGPGSHAGLIPAG